MRVTAAGHRHLQTMRKPTGERIASRRERAGVVNLNRVYPCFSDKRRVAHVPPQPEAALCAADLETHIHDTEER